MKEKSSIAQNKKTPESVIKKGKRGPKGKCKDQTINRFLEAYRAMLPIKECCNYAGITERTYYHWKKTWDMGERSNPELFHLFQQIREIGFQLQKKLLNDILNDKSWKAKVWILKQRWPEYYSESTNVTLSGELKHTYDGTSEDDMALIKGLSENTVTELAEALIRRDYENHNTELT